VSAHLIVPPCYKEVESGEVHPKRGSATPFWSSRDWSLGLLGAGLIVIILCSSVYFALRYLM